jgi:hypothetical protein
MTISTYKSRKQAKLKRKQKLIESDSLVNILFPFRKWIPIPPLDQAMLHEWSKELARTSLYSYSSARDLLESLWCTSYEQLLIDSAFYGRIE